MSITCVSKAVLNHVPEISNIESVESVSGGCINQCYRVRASSQSVFVKYRTGNETMFQSERQGLDELRKSNSFRIPKCIGDLSISDEHCLILEWIEQGQPSANYAEEFAQSLVKLHQTSRESFGFDIDNYIGSLPQANPSENEWNNFFVLHRLEPLVRQAYDQALLGQRDINGFEALFHHLNEIIPSEKPALLHGDLWSGNAMCDEDGKPCIYDPAVYYGHREMDLSMMQLFGGFSPEIFQSYHNLFPLENGFQSRVEIHNLYPLLVHLLLFGSSYHRQISETARRFA